MVIDNPTISNKQDTLVSGTNIKTVNSTSLLGSGDVTVQATLVSGTNIKTVHGTSLLGSGDITTSFTIFPNIIVSGEIKVPSGDTDFICPLIVSIPTGYTATLKNIRYIINGGTSATFNLKKNGTDITNYTSLSCTTTVAETASDSTLADNDSLAIVVSAVSGTPKNLTCRLEILLSKS